MNTKPSMILLTPAQVAKALLWINEAQAHVNSCSADFDGDPESLDTAIELQRLIDAEWDKLGLLVEPTCSSGIYPAQGCTIFT